MREESVARRYAAALLAQAKNRDRVTKQKEELDRAAATVAGNGQLAALLRQPLVTEARKKAALTAALQGAVTAPTLSFLSLLVDKRRIALLAEIRQEFERLVREYQNVALATAVSAVPLTDDQVKALEKSLEARTGKDIELRTEVDPSLIGGVLVRIGDTVLDGSVRGNLLRMREQLLAKR
jgi:F-type H+-transporting ATPase subunit delta